VVEAYWGPVVRLNLWGRSVRRIGTRNLFDLGSIGAVLVLFFDLGPVRRGFGPVLGGIGNARDEH